MPTHFLNSIRRVVPRWRSFSEALLRKELDPFDQPGSQLYDVAGFLAEKERDWRENPDIFHAIDFVNAANVLGVTESAKKAAESVLAATEGVSDLSRDVATRVAGLETQKKRAVLNVSSDIGSIAAEIRKAKARRVVEPRNAFAWMELARLYVLSGLLDKAYRPVCIAVGLAPQNRFVLRSASRYYLHAGRQDEALSLIRRSARTVDDPWLTAAELAISSVLGKSPHCWKAAMRFLDSHNYPPFHLSETAAAVGSIEMWNGRDRRARDVFSAALRAPTENALAQVVWAAKDVGLQQFPFNSLHVGMAFEAEALDARNKGNWELAVSKCDQWADDESFSCRPYGLGSAILASLLDKPERAASTVLRGLLTNPDHPGLLNNLAFSLVESGNPKAAELELMKADIEKADIDTKACLIATAGLVSYRLGDPKKGREFYQATITYATQDNKPLLKSTAQIYLAREMAFSGEQGYEQILEEGARYLEKSGDLYSKALVLRIRKQISNRTGLKGSSSGS